MITRAASFFLLTAAISASRGALYQGFSDDLYANSYDFIIAGGGTAGCVLANRLTENPKFRVLILEAGPSHDGVLNIDMPGSLGLLANSAYDWNFTTVPQDGLSGRTFPFIRGHVLGGTSSINGMLYTRGSQDDYNRWAEVTGDDSWSWKNIIPYIMRNEHFTAPADGHSMAGQYKPAYHNLRGMNYVSLPGYEGLLDNTYIQASKELKDEFPFDSDMNDGSPLGLGWAQSTIGNGTRSSAATSYLGRQYINRRNLDVVLNSRISRVLNSHNGSELDLRTIEFKSADQRLRTLTANKEVVLSLGTVGTPHVLLNSGIGDEDELIMLGIKTILNLPSVGKNFTDHFHTTPTWFVNMTVLPVNSTVARNQWLENRTGPNSNGFANQVIWGRVRNMFTLGPITEPSAGQHSPHFELIPHRAPELLPTGELVLGMHAIVSTIASRGSVSLKSNNSFDYPLINPSYLSADIDLQLMKEAIYSIQRFFNAPTWKHVVLNPQGGFAGVTDDKTLEQFIRNTAAPVYHAVGTAAMSAKGAGYGVVDPNLLLKKAKGLRIVDASIMPFIPSGHTQTPVYAVAERAAELIRLAY